jgi:uncharacterized membrane protein YeiB
VLLFIALANVISYLYGRPVAGVGHRPTDGDPLDRALDLLVALFVSERSFPLFAILLGYGLATISRRLAERGVTWRDVRRVLVRRHLGLLALGGVHVALLFDGDILGLYGMTGLAALPLLRRGPRTRAAWATLSIVLLTAMFSSQGVITSGESPSDPAGYLAAAEHRLLLWPVALIFGTVGLLMLGLVLIGAQLSASGLLDRPAEHVTLLRRLAVGGIGANLVLNLPYALATALVWRPDQPTAYVITGLHALSGVPTGLAYLCLFALLAVRLRDRAPGPLRFAVEAVGRRSLTCYLLQSVLLAPLLSAWGLGLGGRIDTTTAYLIAVGAWVVTVAFAILLARAGRRGPAEVLLRRVTYGAALPHSKFTDGGTPVRRAAPDTPPGRT